MMRKRRLAAILAIDVVDYSRMMGNDAANLLTALNKIFRTIVKPCVDQESGRVVKLLGDGALVEFSSAQGALSCAVAIQEKMQAADGLYRYDEVIQLRMGVHAGDILIEGQDIFGDGVNVAARLQEAAAPGGILLSKTVAVLAGGGLSFTLRGEGTHRLKNIAAPVETLSVVFAETGKQTQRRDIAQSLPVRFCSGKDGQTLAWTEVGDGPPIVKAPSWVNHLKLIWRDPGLAHLLHSLSTRHRLIYFDARANGMSDWECETISFESAIDDLECVFDAAGVEWAPVIGVSQGGAMAAAFAARAKERVSALVMLGSYPLGRAKRKSQKDRASAAALRTMFAAGWDDDPPSLRDLMAQIIIPGASVEDQRQYAEDMRTMISPETIGRYREMLDNMDVTALLPQVEAPSLILHCTGDRMHPTEQGRKMAAGIPNAKFIPLDSDNHNLTENDPCWPPAEREIHAFLQAHR